MATVKFWTGGASDGDFSNLSNWNEATAFANSDTYIIGATNQNITAGLTHAYTGITLIVTEGYGGSIGSGASPLSFSSVAALTYAGRGAFAKFGSSGTVTTASCDHVSGFVYIATGTWTELTNSMGNMDIAAAAVVTRLNNIGGTVTAGYNGTAFTNLFSGGTTTFRRNATNAYIMGGRTVQENNGMSNFTLIATILQVHRGATYNKRSSGAETAATQVFPGATYTVAGNTGGAAGGGATTVDVGPVVVWAGSKAVFTGVPGITFDVDQVTYKGANYGAVGQAD